MKGYDPMLFEYECCKPFFFEGNGHGVLLIHGFTGSVAHMRPLGESLWAKGYTVRGINLPGHALDEEAMAKSDWKQWLQATKEATLEMKERCETVTVCGLSMGGVLALLVAEQMKIDACVPISAPMATRNRLISVAALAALFYPRVAWKSQGERRADLNRDYDYGYSGFPTKRAGDLNHLIRLARRDLFNINCPILCVQSDADQAIWRGSADTIIGNVGSQERQKLWLKDVPHVCTLSQELPTIVDEMDSLLKRVIAAAQAAKRDEQAG